MHTMPRGNRQKSKYWYEKGLEHERKENEERTLHRDGIMTNEEAINIIRSNWPSDNYSELQIALSKAITLLRKGGK